MRVHAECAHEITILLRAIQKLGLVDLARDIVPDLIGHFDADADIDAVVLLLDAKAVAFIRKPFRTGTARCDDEIRSCNRLAVLEFQAVIPLPVRFDMCDRAFKAELHLVLEIFIRAFQHAKVVLRAKMAHTGAQEVQIMLQRQRPMSEPFVE